MRPEKRRVKPSQPRSRHQSLTGVLEQSQPFPSAPDRALSLRSTPLLAEIEMVCTGLGLQKVRLRLSQTALPGTVVASGASAVSRDLCIIVV